MANSHPHVGLHISEGPERVKTPKSAAVFGTITGWQAPAIVDMEIKRESLQRYSKSVPAFKRDTTTPKT